MVIRSSLTDLDILKEMFEVMGYTVLSDTKLEEKQKSVAQQSAGRLSYREAFMILMSIIHDHCDICEECPIKCGPEDDCPVQYHEHLLRKFGEGDELMMKCETCPLSDFCAEVPEAESCSEILQMWLTRELEDLEGSL